MRQNHRWPMGLALILVINSGCDNLLHPPSGGSSGVWHRTRDLEANFYLMDAARAPQTRFSPGEPLNFHYSLVNTSENSLPYSLPHIGPFARFEVRRGALLVGTSDDGFGYPTVMVLDTLKADSLLVQEYAWRSVPLHGELPRGNYLATAYLHLNFDATQTPLPLSLPFEVSCDGPAPECDTVGSVIITDTPADSLWLDSFELNAANVDGDILALKLSFSGGCAHHDFALFMTPAAFMESNPVQANLVLNHDSHADPCDAYLTQKVRFDLRPLAELHRQTYGSRDEIILRIKSHPDDPSDDRSVSYFPN